MSVQAQVRQPTRRLVSRMPALSASAGPSRIAASARHVPLSAMRSFSQTSRSTAENPSSRPQPARTYRAASTPRPTPRPAARPAPAMATPPVIESVDKPRKTVTAGPIPANRQISPTHTQPRSTLQAATDPGSHIDRSYVDWPWHQVPSPSLDTMIEERLVFARPNEMFGNARNIRAVWMLGGVCVCFIIVVPMASDLPDAPAAEVPDDAPNAEAMKESRERNQETIEQNRQAIAKILDREYWIKGVLALGIISGVVAATKMHANNITRLVQIRETPRAGGAATHRIRYRTSMVDADLPFYQELREANLDQFRPRLITRNNSLVAMSIGGGPDKYRLDFTPSKALNDDPDQEVVLSIARLERLFGELIIPEQRKSKFGMWVSSWRSSKKA